MKCQVLMKVLQCGSFTEAGHALGYSQSGISHIISSLEKEIGLSILTRDRTGTRMTSDGELLMPYITSLYNAECAFYEQVDRLKDIDTGKVCIAADRGNASHRLPKIMKEFHKHYPHIHFELIEGQSSEIAAAVRSGRADCGFCALTDAQSLTEIHLYNDRFMAVLPESHEPHSEDCFALKEVSQYPFIQLYGETGLKLKNLFEEQNIKANIQYTVQDEFAVLALVEEGLGISLLPEYILQRGAYRVRTIPLSANIEQKAGLLYDHRAHLSPSAQAFFRFVINNR